MIEVEFMKSNIKTKKLTAVFYKDNKKIKTECNCKTCDYINYN